jgi:hypothetical protein
MKTYLIARAKIQERKDKKGIDSIIKLDYMGAYEYEWGVIPNSLKRIRENLDKYIYINVLIKDLVITVFCHESKKDEVKQYLTDLAYCTMRTKCGHHFDWYIEKSKKTDFLYVRDKVNFWWDIENDLMFWIRASDFEEKFKKVIINNIPVTGI